MSGYAVACVSALRSGLIFPPNLRLDSQLTPSNTGESPPAETRHPPRVTSALCAVETSILSSSVLAFFVLKARATLAGARFGAIDLKFSITPVAQTADKQSNQSNLKNQIRKAC